MPELDDRQFAALAEELRRTLPAYAPGWTDFNDSDPGVTLLEVSAFLAEEIAGRPEPLPRRAHRRAAAGATALVAAAEPGATVELVVDGAPWPPPDQAAPAGSRTATLLRWFLVVLGGLAALGAATAVMPTAWMEAVTARLGLEPLPRTPLTQYLTRSLSIVYAHLGLFVLWLALDVRRNRRVIEVLGWLTMVLGAALTVLDLWAGMPAAWTWGEGPPTVLCGALMVWLARRLRG